MYPKIITISREFGSGGRTIGKQVAEKLGFAFYDKELVDKIALTSGLSKEYIEKKGEESTFGNSFLHILAMDTGLNYEVVPLQDQLFTLQSNIIKEIAEKEKCVIVGRCGDYVLRNREDCLKVHIFADDNFKEKRIVELYGEREENPKKRLQKKDKRRKNYYEYYTGQKWGYAHNYDICLNSSILGVEECGQIIIDLIKKKENKG